MSRIHSNIAALTATRHLARNQADLRLHLQRLSTGLRINRGADDPAGLIASERLRSEMRTIGQAIENSERASHVLATAEGALQEVSSLLLDLQSLIVSSANQSGLTDEEVRANQLQIDSILASINRIANTTSFAGRRLLSGDEEYQLSGADPAAFAQVDLYSFRLPRGSTRALTVQVIQSAQTARLEFLASGSGSYSAASPGTVQIRGNLGAQTLSFASGASLAEIQTAINNVTGLTGVLASISSSPASGTASALILSSASFGSRAFVAVEPISGAFIASPAGTQVRDHGADVGVLVNGFMAEGNGLEATVRNSQLDAQFSLTPGFAQTLSVATLHAIGGGGVFQITPQVTPNGQVPFALDSVHTSRLGSSEAGYLYSLGTGYSNDLNSKNFTAAQAIVNEAISKVAMLRGRIGNLQRNQIETNINSQNIALENVTAAESAIRDADVAQEVSALTRAQILTQSTQIALKIANSIPGMVLPLLQ